MRNRTWLILGLAVVTGGIAAYLAFTYLQQEPGDEPQQTTKTQPVAVAAKPLPVGTVLQQQHVKMVDWPAGNVPTGFASSPSEVVGRGLLTSVAQNEPLLSSKLALKEAGGGLPITIPEGKRAVSVRVNEVVNVAGFVQPGSRVDVLVTMDAESGGQPATQVILKNIQVLSAGQRIQENQEGEPQNYSVATLLVTPEQAEKLTLAATRGQLQLALRNPLDMDSIQTPGIAKPEVIQLRAQQQAAASPAPTPRRAPSRVQVEVYRGPERSTSTVDTATGGGR